MKSLQQEVTRYRNRAANVTGPLWQGRYKARQVDDERYLRQLIAYVHLNPVTAGLVAAPTEYRWSGHREVLGILKDPLVSVDDVLAVYGEGREEATSAYRAALRDVANLGWPAGAPDRLQWWRAALPGVSSELNPRGGVAVDELGRPTSPYRRRFKAEEWIETVCPIVGVDRQDLAGRSRSPQLVQMRDLVGLVGVERFGVKVKDLAASLRKSDDGVSLWVRRGARRRETDAAFAAEVEALDSVVREGR
ncbi:MAG: hypothetical protein JRI23_11690 [Deltaproteobacteria bacterium]|jgi:hypothetical protein|nr:hypothetical protein [Deltaproteobacteria bacterium]MBW2532361.1 hypothetical protein [Deltaproteobacteria bacterium]